jgi:IclR family acetate operon transcriptional repressor
LLVESGQIQRTIQATRARGYSIDEQEYAVGVSGVASWIVFGDRQSVASLAVLAPSDRLAGSRLARIGERTRALAAELSFARRSDQSVVRSVDRRR